MTIFETWWRNFADTVWADNLLREDKLAVAWPQDHTLLEAILRDSAFSFIDNIKTPKVETLPQMLTAALNKTAEELKKVNDLRWAVYKDTRVRHLLSGLPGFSRLHLPIGGGAKIINATKSTHGPSWRVVVHMSDETEAYGVYPGGQSGNPGSRFYDMFIDIWASGQYYPLWIMKPSEKNSGKVKWKMTFTKA